MGAKEKYYKFKKDMDDLEIGVHPDVENFVNELELTIAKILDNRLEDDKLYLIIDRAFEMTPGDYIRQFKKQLGYYKNQ